MKKLLIATHGRMASGIKSSIKILTGLQDQIIALDAYVDDGDYRKDIKKFIEQANGTPCVILTDIIGGSVEQAAMILSKEKRNVFVVCGVNLPIVLSLLMSSEPITQELLNKLIKESQVKLVKSDIAEWDAHKKNYQDEDFFAL